MKVVDSVKREKISQATVRQALGAERVTPARIRPRTPMQEARREIVSNIVFARERIREYLHNMAVANAGNGMTAARASRFSHDVIYVAVMSAHIDAHRGCWRILYRMRGKLE